MADEEDKLRVRIADEAYAQTALRVIQEEEAAVVVITVLGGKRGSGSAFVVSRNNHSSDEAAKLITAAPFALMEVARVLRASIVDESITFEPMQEPGAPPINTKPGDGGVS